MCLFRSVSILALLLSFVSCKLKLRWPLVLTPMCSENAFSSFMTIRPPGISLPAVVKQVEYYLSPQNYLNDSYLQNLALSDGWIPIAAVCEFNRMKRLRAGDPFEVATLLRKHSRTVEVDTEACHIRPIWRLHPWKAFHPSQCLASLHHFSHSCWDASLNVVTIWYPPSCLYPMPACYSPSPQPSGPSTSQNISQAHVYGNSHQQHHESDQTHSHESVKGIGSVSRK